MTSEESRNMASGGPREPKKPTRKCYGLEWDVYNDHTQKAWTGWESVQQPWSAEIVLQFVGFPHFDRLWPRPCYERHCRALSANDYQLEKCGHKMEIFNNTQKYLQFDKMSKERNSKVSGMYDVCGARVASQSGLVKSGYSKQEKIWEFRNCIL